MSTEVKKAPRWAGCAVLVIAAAILATIVIMVVGDSPPAPTKPAAELREERIKKAFSAWDGSHRNLEAWVKEAMNDPASYEHIGTSYREKGDTVFVMLQFRGKNAFGGVVKNTATCYTDLDGNILGVPSIIK